MGKVNKNLRTDFLIIVAIVLAFIPTIIIFEVRFITSTILFFAVPSVYLLIRKPKQIKRLVASVVAGIVMAFSVDFLAEFNGAWSAVKEQLFFSYKVFSVIPIDFLIWYVLWIFLTVVYYEHFFENDRSNKISKNFKKALLVFSSVLVLIILIFYIRSQFGRVISLAFRR